MAGALVDCGVVVSATPLDPRSGSEFVGEVRAAGGDGWSGCAKVDVDPLAMGPCNDSGS